MNSCLPRLSYTLWFSQRCGSTWFASLLEATGRAGRPREHLNFSDRAALLAHYQASTAEDLAARIREAGMTDNGVFAIKQGYFQPNFAVIAAALSGGTPMGIREELAAWERVFPSHRHIFMMRRNKVRQAVSWWRAIRSGEWHRIGGAKPNTQDLAAGYDAAAIRQLLNEIIMREAGISEMLAAASVTPLTVCYEDLCRNPDGEVRRTLAFLGLPEDPLPPSSSPHRRIADEVSEVWTQRFREEMQQGWNHRGW